MRIAFVPAARVIGDDLPNGEALAAMGVLRELASRGHELLIYCERSEIREPIPNATIIEISAEGTTAAAGRIAFSDRIGRDLAKRHAEKPVEVAHLLLPITVDEGYAPALPAGVPLVIGPVTGSWPRAASSSPRLAARAAGLLTDPVEKRRHRKTLRSARSILVATSDAANQLPQELRDRFVPCSPGVVADRFAPEPLPDEPNIGFLSVLQHRKGVHILLEAFPTVRERVPRARLFIAGDDPQGLRPALEARASELGVADAVTFLDGIAPADTPGFYSNIRVFCQPSIGEPFGATVLEAMAKGRPVVATCQGGPADTVVDGITGRLVPPDSVEALADALVQLLADPSSAERFAIAGAERAREVYDLPLIVSTMERAYTDHSQRVHAS
jgi:glycosyltransferase involved in cell wall biosynthesis